jgi:hypothetical protein
VSGPPYGTRCLIVSCHDPREAQFAGIGRIAAELSGRFPGLFSLDWRGGSLELQRRRTLAAVIVSGHGAADRARLRTPDGSFTPGSLRLPTRAALYLLACYQGRVSLRGAWAKGTGIDPGRVHGPDGETDSSLSTCLFLHLLTEGPGCLERRFGQWLAANLYLSPHFPRLRRLYERCGGDPLATLKKLGEAVDLAPVADFIGVCGDYPRYLRGLATV